MVITSSYGKALLLWQADSGCLSCNNNVTQAFSYFPIPVWLTGLWWTDHGEFPVGCDELTMWRIDWETPMTLSTYMWDLRQPLAWIGWVWAIRPTKSDSPFVHCFCPWSRHYCDSCAIQYRTFVRCIFVHGRDTIVIAVQYNIGIPVNRNLG